MDRVRLLGRVLHTPVDLGIEVGEPSVDRLGQPLQAPVDLGSAALQLARVVGAEGRQRTREPDGEAGQDESEDQ